MKRKRILFLISTLTGGGAERVVCNLSLALEDRADVDILVNAASPEDYPHGGRVLTLGLPFTKKMTLAYQLRVFVKRLARLCALKRTGGYDACISFMNSSNFANILSGRRNCRCIVSERIMLSLCRSKNYRYFVWPLVRLLYPFADRVVAVSEETAWDLNKRFNVKKEQLFTIYNGLDIDAIKRQAQEAAPEGIFEGGGDDKDACFYFLNIGRMSVQKGQWHIIRAFSHVAKKHPRSRLIICGSGRLQEHLRRLAADLGISDRVIFTGFIKNPYAIAASCDAYVSASLYEGFSNVLIEAMACGLPVISTDFRSSAREILSPERIPGVGDDWDEWRRALPGDEIEYARYGVLLPMCSGTLKGAKEPPEPSELLLAQAMERIMEDEELRRSYAARSEERARELHIDRIAEKWLELV